MATTVASTTRSHHRGGRLRLLYFLYSGSSGASERPRPGSENLRISKKGYPNGVAASQ